MYNDFIPKWETATDELLNDFLGFGKPKGLIFNSMVKDMMPSYWTKKDDNTYICTVKTIGINAEDIKVEESKNGLFIKGETELEGYKYNTSMELPVAQEIMNDIKEIKVKTLNGLTFITLTLNKPEKRKINISYDNK